MIEQDRDATREEIELIVKCCERFEEYAQYDHKNKTVTIGGTTVKYQRFEMLYSLELAHVNSENGIDLERLLNFPRYDFMHDMLGIWENVSRETGRMLNCFSPRSTNYKPKEE